MSPLNGAFLQSKPSYKLIMSYIGQKWSRILTSDLTSKPNQAKTQAKSREHHYNLPNQAVFIASKFFETLREGHSKWLAVNDTFKNPYSTIIFGHLIELAQKRKDENHISCLLLAMQYFLVCGFQLTKTQQK